METNTVSGLLDLISAAVTPVVLISACAALILGINNKHTGISDRMRTMAAEYRQAETLPARRRQIYDEILVFRRRFRLTWYALGALYGAVMLFTATTLQIIFTHRRLATGPMSTLALFEAGVVLMFVASCLEIFEVFFSLKSLDIEMRDLPSSPPD
ncbi:MAG TPA: DUF2721 domain-containing protein [Chthonomonadaceae bacterium]|nr:DUF2721 domain-containing protein [Chthonomonadaceae bacterium]